MAITHMQYADGLRAFADWVEAHEEIPLPWNPRIGYYHLNGREDAERLVRALGRCEKRWSDTMLFVERQFGALQLQAAFYRDKVCERKVVGVKKVEEQVIPEKVVPAHKEEIVEWECHSLLTPGVEPPEPAPPSDDVPF